MPQSKKASGTAETPPSDSAMQTRIITHMNADHAASLSLFLQHYNKLSPAVASDPQLDEFTLDHMTIRSRFGRTYIPLSPPLATYADARQRMVDMDAEALRGLGLSATTVDEYVAPPMGLPLAWFGVSLVCLVAFSPLGAADLGREAVHSRVNLLYMFFSVGGLVPGLSYFAHDVARYVFAFMLVVHGGEAGWLVYSRLRKHQVEAGTLVWWQWVMSCLIEGFPSFRRFDKLVKGKEEEKAKKKH